MGTRRTGELLSVEGLEARTLMAAFDYQTVGDLYGLPDVLLDLRPPAMQEPEGYGAAIAGLGDLNQDGFADFAIANPQAGWIGLYSGRDGAVIRELLQPGAAGAGGFGTVLANVGDVDGDGVPDLAAGAPAFDADSDATVDRHGAVWVYSGASGELLHFITGEGDEDELGYAVAAAGDLNHDGRPDVLLGAPGAGPHAQGHVVLLSGLDGTVLEVLTGEHPGDRFGHAVAARDVAGPGESGPDGIADIAIGAPGFDRVGGAGSDHGRVYVYSGATSDLLYMLEEQGPGAAYGSTLAFARTPEGLRLLVGSRPPAGDGSDFYKPIIRFYHAGSGSYTGVALYTSPLGAWTDEQVRFWVIPSLRHPDRDVIARALLVKPAGEWVWKVDFSETTATGVETLNILASSDPAPIGPVVAAVGDVNGDGLDDVLSAEFSPAGRVTVRSGLWARQNLYGERGRGVGEISGLSPDGRWLWSNPELSAGPEAELFGFLVGGGEVRSYAKVPGLGRATILDVNSEGVIVGADLVDTGSGAEAAGRKFVLRGGVKTYLEDEAATVAGGAAKPDFDEVFDVKLGDGGHIVFQSSSGAGYGAWLLQEGVLTYLWDGFVSGVNRSGMIVGTRWTPGQTGVTVVRYGDGTTIDVPGFFNAGAVNDRGQVAGQSGNELAVWDAGRITLLPRPNFNQGSKPPTVPPVISSILWRPYDIDRLGRVSTYVMAYVGTMLVREGYVLYGREMGAFFSEWLQFPGDVTPRLVDNGWTYSERGVNVPASGAEQKLGAPLASITTPDGTATVGIAPDGNGWLLRETAAGREYTPLSTLLYWSGEASPLVDIDLYIEPSDGTLHIVGLTESGALRWWGGVSAPQRLGSSTPDFALRAGLAVMVGPDGVVRVAGRNAAGELIVYFQTGAASPDSPLNWSATNITLEHLEPQGLAMPTLAGDLTTMVTPWNGLNIVGVDETGHLQTFWWAPGMDRWRVDDLTQIVGGPALSGRVSAYVTGWGGLNVAGTDSGGRLHVAWWAPGMTAWRSDELPEARLTPGSISTYVTPWGGLNIAGIDPDGDVAVAWWTPGFDDWNFDHIDPDFGRLGAEAVGQTMVAGAVSPAGGIELTYRQFARDEIRPWLKPGHVTRLTLDPFTGMWIADDMTMRLS